MNWRHIPHPSYGNYGGALNKCKHGCEEPIDWMDRAFKEHDSDLRDKRLSSITADALLIDALLLGVPKELARPYYGVAYRVVAIIIFSIADRIRK